MRSGRSFVDLVRSLGDLTGLERLNIRHGTTVLDLPKTIGEMRSSLAKLEHLTELNVTFRFFNRNTTVDLEGMFADLRHLRALSLADDSTEKYIGRGFGKMDWTSMEMCTTMLTELRLSIAMDTEIVKAVLSPMACLGTNLAVLRLRGCRFTLRPSNITLELPQS